MPGFDEERAALVAKSLARVEDGRHPLGHADVHFQGLLLMVFGPLCVFTAVSTALGLCGPYPAVRLLGWCVALLALCLAAVLWMVHQRSKVHIYRVLALLTVLATVLGSQAGLFVYDRTMLPYYMNRGRTAVTNVSASASSVDVYDASAVEFQNGTRIDFRFSFGYRSITEDPGTTYCVAPVMDFKSQTVGEARFWAVGTDCCEPTWGFACGASLDMNARSGSVVRNIPASARASERFWNFRRAVKQAGAMYRLGIPEDPVLVVWQLDANSEVQGYWKWAILYLILWCLLFFMVSMTVAGVLHHRWTFGSQSEAARVPRTEINGYGAAGGQLPGPKPKPKSGCFPETACYPARSGKDLPGGSGCVPQLNGRGPKLCC